MDKIVEWLGQVTIATMSVLILGMVAYAIGSGIYMAATELERGNIDKAKEYVASAREWYAQYEGAKAKSTVA